MANNWDFEIAPAFVAAQTQSNWVDGTATGGSTPSSSLIHSSGNGGGATSQFDSANPHTGNYSFKIHVAAGTFVEARVGTKNYFSADGVAWLPNSTYTYSVWVKSQNVSGSATGGHVQFLFSNAAGAATALVQPTTGNEFIAAGPVTTNQGWTQYTGNFTTGPGVAWLHTEFRVYGHNGAGTLTGDFWFDDLVITRVNSATTNDLPVSTIGEQSQTTPPFTPDNTLVDDPVALVDDPTALVGGRISIVEGLQSKVESLAPRAKIDTYR